MPFDLGRRWSYHKYTIPSTSSPDGECHILIEPDAPRYLYRYLNLQYAHDLLAYGQFRLGSLFSYRGQENNTLTESQKDELEGLLTCGWVDQDRSYGQSVTAYNSWLMCLSPFQNIDFYTDFDRTNSIVQIEIVPFLFSLAWCFPFTDTIALRKVQYVRHEDMLFNRPLERHELPLAFATKLDLEKFSRHAEWRIIVEPLEAISGRKRDTFGTPRVSAFSIGIGQLTYDDRYWSKDTIGATIVECPSVRRHCKLVDAPWFPRE